MKVRYIGSYYSVVLEQGAIYEVTQIEGGLYRIFSENVGESGLFPPDIFEIVEAEPVPLAYAADDPKVAIY